MCTAVLKVVYYSLDRTSIILLKMTNKYFCEYNIKHFQPLPTECHGKIRLSSIIAYDGHLNILKKLVVYLPPETIYYAIIGQQLIIIKYLNQCGVNFYPGHVEAAIEGGDLDIIKYIFMSGSKFQAYGGFWQSMIRRAAEYGHLHVIKYLYQQHVPKESDACYDAVKGNQILCLEYLCVTGHSINEECFNLCVRRGNLEMLKILYHYDSMSNPSWSWYTFSIAAYKGNLSILSFLFQHGCPYDHRAYDSAITSNNLNTVKYLHSIQCPYNKQDLIDLLRQGIRWNYREELEYILEYVKIYM